MIKQQENKLTHTLREANMLTLKTLKDRRTGVQVKVALWLGATAAKKWHFLARLFPIKG